MSSVRANQWRPDILRKGPRKAGRGESNQINIAEATLNNAACK